ncbi:YDG domain-containing protein [Polaromonas sp. YR568]|uniref:YDG domain-containing protein n=1 Tax=Polaromonas sp. YR568 TaxID=1855301 RepID=UPI00398BEB0F
MKSHASMNRIYRLVWNAALSLWVAVAENAKGQSKGGSARSSVLFASAHAGEGEGGDSGGFTLNAACRAAVLMLAVGVHHAHAADAANASVSAGAASVATVGNTTTINQSTQRAAIDWTSLSTRANEALVFNQPNAQAIALNRITGASPSELLGSLTANGQVFILNPNGVLFGAGSQVNVGGLVASTLSLSNADFEAGNYKFTGSGGSVVNQGTLNAAPGGYLALLAPEVRNEGVMTASLGTALLAAGNKVTLNLDNGSLLGYSIDQGAINALAENKQLIKADGGQVLLSAKAMDSLTTATVNNTGVIEARTLQNKAGRIMLMGDMAAGTVNVGGTLDASAPGGGNGGFIETSAANVNVAAGTRVTTKAASGQSGTWLIDPVDFTIAAGSAAQTTSGMGADTLSTALDAGNVSIATSATTAGAGDIHVNSDVSWSANPSTLTLTAHRDVNFNASITYAGSGTAGLTALAGRNVAVASNKAIAATGAGSLAVVFNSMRTGSQAGIAMATGSSITTNGGDIVFGGGADPLTGFTTTYADGITLDGASLSSGAGDISLRGSGQTVGIRLTNGATISSTTGDVTLTGSGRLDNNRGDGVYLQSAGTAISTTGGNINITGSGLDGRSGVYIDSARVTAGNAGSISITGSDAASGSGIVMANTYSSAPLIQTANGNITLTGQSGSYSGNSAALHLDAGSVTSTGTGNVHLAGTNVAWTHSAANYGTYIGGQVQVTSGGGDVSVYGTAGAGAGSSIGLWLSHSSRVGSYGAGNVQVVGVGGTGAGGGAGIDGIYATIMSSGGNISVSGTSSGTDAASVGAKLPAFTISNSGTGAIRITGDATQTSVTGSARPAGIANFYAGGTSAIIGGPGYAGDITIVASASPDLTIDTSVVPITTTGHITFETARPDIAMTVQTNSASDTQGDSFQISARTLSSVTAGHSGITFGTGTSTASLTVAGPSSFTAPVTLKSGTGGIAINNDITSTSSLTVEATGGAITAPANINVAMYRQLAGTFSQVGSTLPTFSATDFRVDGGTFIRALGGDGLSAGSAYQLTDVYGLQGAGSTGMLNKHYKLANDIDASGTAAWNGGAGLTPIGDNTTQFTGTFDGENKTISNLTINRPAEEATGLFGHIGYGGTVKKVGLTNVSVIGDYIVGGLAGYNEGAISDSYSTGTVSGGMSVGGLVGDTTDVGTIVGSYSAANVSGDSGVGGLVGNSGGAIYDSYATGAVTGSNSSGAVGGLVGSLGYFGFVSSSYSNGSVSGTGGFIGGLIGHNLPGLGSVNSSFWDTDTSGQATSAGGTGKTTAEMKQASTFSGWSMAATGGSGNVWRIYEGNTGPLLRGFLTAYNLTPDYDGGGTPMSAIGSYSTAGADMNKLLGTAAPADTLTLRNTGTADGYTATSSASGHYSHQQGYDLTATRTIATPGSAAGDVRLDNDISYSSGTLALAAANNLDLNGRAIDASSGMLHIRSGTLQISSGTAINAGAVNVDVFNMAGGTWSQVGPAPAAFAALDFGISGGTFVRALGGDGTPGNAYQLADVYGLQGAGSAGMLDKNYTLANNIAAASTMEWNGGFKPIGDNTTGYSGTFDGNNKTINNLQIVRSGEDLVGLFGKLDAGGSILNVGMANAVVVGSSNVGGLVGYSEGSISNSSVSGFVWGINITGGLVGYAAGSISNSYASGSVNGHFKVGGLAGYNNGSISNSYATGTAAGNADVGGLVGVNVGGTVTASFWQDTTSGFGTNSGTVDGLSRGLSSAEFTSAATYTTAGWNASNVGGDGTAWRIYEGNTGPLLRSFMAGLTLADTTVTYNGTAQQGATTNDVRVLGGSHASGRNAGTHATGYFSGQQGVDIIGGMLTIDKADLSLTTMDVTKIYDSGMSANGTAIVTAGTTLQGSDTMSGGTFAFADKNAGAGNKMVHTGGVTVNDNNGGNNYNVSYIDNTTSTINQATLTISGITASDRTYNATDVATVDTTGASYNGLFTGDVVNLAATGLFVNKNVGTGKTVNLSSSYSGADAGNYAITDQVTTTASISQASLSIGGITAGDRTYNATDAATVDTTGASYNGLFMGDVVNVAATGLFDNKNVGTGKTVNLSSSYSGADAGNYTITDQVTTTASISQASLSIGGITAGDRTYNATDAATVDTTGASYNGLFMGDVVNVAATGLFDNKNVGTGKTVNLSSSYGGADAGNYAITDQAITTASISQASLTVTASGISKVYDGTTTATVAYSGGYAGDALSFTGSVNFADQNAGLNKAVSATGIAVNGVDAGNYNLLNTTATTTASITPKVLTVTAADDAKNYDGVAYSGGAGVSYNGFVAGDSQSDIGGALAYGGSSQGAIAAGRYVITPGGLRSISGNYTLGFNSGALSIAALNASSASLGGTALVGAYDGAMQAVAGLGGSSSGGGGGGFGGSADAMAGALSAAAAEAGNTGEE